MKEQNISIKDLAKQVQSQNPDMSLDKVIEVVKLLFDEISNALIFGDKVELRGFCSLQLKRRKSPYARNPRTNEEIAVQNHMTLNFRPSRDLLSRLNSDDSDVDSMTAAAA